jgi:selenide,water dikinase
MSRWLGGVMTATPTLTSLAHGGGCGCKLSPGVLRDILRDMPVSNPFASLLVGAETSDDAAVWRLNAEQALVATTDFFMPIVDDPSDFGRISAANALSDIYAMGATPIFALAVVGMPVGKLAPEVIRAVLAGGASICEEAGIPIAGGHSIDSAEPIYGLVALGLVHPDRVMRNNTGRAGDALVLTKALGVGVLSAALKQGLLHPAGYETLVVSTTRLNAIGIELAATPGVHAMTDVTGFGLLGHALEMCRGADLSADITASPPMLSGAEALARDSVRTGAAVRNWESYGADVDETGLEPWRRDVLCDPQTSGGLLVAVHPDSVDAVLDLARFQGFDQAAVVGRLGEGPATVRVAA